MGDLPPISPKNPASAKALSASKTMPRLQIKPEDLLNNISGAETDNNGMHWGVSKYQVGNVKSVAVQEAVAVKNDKGKTVGYWCNDPETPFYVSSEGKMIIGAGRSINEIADINGIKMGDLSKESYILVKETDIPKLLGVVYVSTEDRTAFNK